MIRPGAGYKDKKNVIGKKLKKDVVSGSILKKESFNLINLYVWNSWFFWY